MVRARMTDYGAERLEHDFEERVSFHETDLRLSNYDASDDSATREKTDFLNDARCPDRLEMTGLSDQEREAVHGRLRETLDDRTAPNDVEARLGFAQAAAERLTDEDADPNWTEAYIYGLRHGEDPKTLDFY